MKGLQDAFLRTLTFILKNMENHSKIYIEKHDLIYTFIEPPCVANRLWNEVRDMSEIRKPN